MIGVTVNTRSLCYCLALLMLFLLLCLYFVDIVRVIHGDVIVDVINYCVVAVLLCCYVIYGSVGEYVIVVDVVIVLSFYYVCVVCFVCCALWRCLRWL